MLMTSILSDDLRPGELVVIMPHALARRHASNEEHYTGRPQFAIVVQLSHRWHEVAGDVKADYLVMFSNDGRCYYVSRGEMLRPDRAADPSRLFGRLRG